MSNNGDCLAGNEVQTKTTVENGAANIVQDLWKPASGSNLKSSETNNDTKFSFGPDGEATIPPLNDSSWQNALAKDLGSSKLSEKSADNQPKDASTPTSQPTEKDREIDKKISDALKLLDLDDVETADSGKEKGAENAEKKNEDPEAQLKKDAEQVAKFIGDDSLGKNPYQRRVIQDILAKATDGGEEHFNKLVEEINKNLKERNSPLHLEGKFSEIDVNFTYVGNNDIYYPHGKDFKMPSSKLALVDNTSGEKQDELNNIAIRNPDGWMATSDPALRASRMAPFDLGMPHKNVIEPPEPPIRENSPIDTGLPPLESELGLDKRTKTAPPKKK